MKFHVNPESGVVSVCTATKRACPLGGREFHFKTAVEAKEFGEALMSSKYPETVTTRRAGKLFIFVGLPGSGKSTLAKELAKLHPGSLIANRDDMRTELFGEKYHLSTPDGKSEAAITNVLNERMTKKFREGGVVLDDNTNMNARFLYTLVQLAKNYGAEVEIITVDVSVAEAKRRNAKRGNSGGRLVPEFVIDRMAQKAYSEDGRIKDVLIGDKLVAFVDQETPGMKLLEAYNQKLELAYPILGKDIALVDIDGTLSFNHEALDRNIGSVEYGVKKDWSSFYKDSEDSPVNESVLKVVHKLRRGGITVFALTGRVDQHAESTINFLQKASAPISRVLMGRAGDFRGDYNVKNSVVDSLHAAGFTIAHSIDDRPSSIRVWEERGISVSRVPHHLVSPLQASYTQSAVDDITGQGFCISCSGELPIGEIIHETCRSL